MRKFSCQTMCQPGDSALHKRILQQLGLPLKCLPGVPGVLHEGDLLRDETCEIQDLDASLIPLSSILSFTFLTLPIRQISISVNMIAHILVYNTFYHGLLEYDRERL